MNEYQLRKIFPRASQSVIKANSDDSDCGRKIAEPQCASINEPLAKNKVKKADPRKYDICITSVRKRLLDPDNLCPKYHIDALRYANFLLSDSPDKVTLKTTQRRCKKQEREHVVIEINFL